MMVNADLQRHRAKSHGNGMKPASALIGTTVGRAERSAAL
jgi:hypothetical protein